MRCISKAESSTIRQITSRTRLRQLLTKLHEASEAGTQPADADLRVASEILADAVDASETLIEIAIVDDFWKVIVSNNPTKAGDILLDRRGLPDDVQRSMMTSPVDAGSVSADALVAAPMQYDGQRLGVVVCRVDTSRLIAILEDTTPLGESSKTWIANLGRPESREAVFGPASGDVAQSGFETIANNGESNLVFWQPISFCDGTDTRHSFVATLPTAIAFAPLGALRSSLVFAIFAVTALNAAIAYLSARRTESRLRKLIADIGEADFTEPIDVSSSDDFGFLASAFNDMSREVTSRMEALKEGAAKEHTAYNRLTGEIRIAQQIQQCLYPTESLEIPTLEVVGRAIAAENLCGDYFDYFEVDDEVVFAIGDVSGHGIGPALLMVELRGAVRGLRWTSISLVDVVNRLNKLLATGTPPGRFVTFFLGRVHRESGELEYVGAGHRGFVVRADGEIEELQSTGMVLGLVSDTKFSVRRTIISDGDVVFLASDGIEETRGENGDLYGRDRMLSIVASHLAESLPEVIEKLFDDTHSYSGHKENADDCTVLMLRRRSES